MNTITLIEYLNYINQGNNPIGHGKKVLNQMVNLLQDAFLVNCKASDAYMPNGIRNNNQQLKAICQTGKSNHEISQLVFKNLLKCNISEMKSDIIWFTNSDWHLFVFLFFAKTNQKIVTTVYRDVIRDAQKSKSKFAFLKRFFVEQGAKKVSLFIVSNPNLKISHNQVFIPDYILSKEYSKFISYNKRNGVLCVGAMRKSKDIEGVIKHFNGTDVEVRIVGSFQDKKWRDRLTGIAANNIVVEDRELSYDEYYSLIGNYRFIILPYDMNVYENATSGVLLEALFLKSTPIAPRELLAFNGLPGIGYDSISCLPSSLQELTQEKFEYDIDLTIYEEEYIRERLIIALKDTIQE